MGENETMNVGEEIDTFLEEHDFEGSEAEVFVNLLKRASKELKALAQDGETLLQIIENKNHNSSIMRRRIADLEKENRELKKQRQIHDKRN